MTDYSDQPGSTEEVKLLELARRRFGLVSDAEAKQRARELADLEFQVPENQWSPEAKKERGGGNGVPPRPMLSIDLTKQPIQLVNNQAARARLGVNLHPVSEDADDELAEIKQGLYRRIERDGQADQARLWALDRAIKCGRGWYRVIAKYDEDADPDGPGAWDQELGFERILYQERVYPDPAAQKPDFSDAEYIFVVAWKTQDEMRREYPKSKAAQANSGLDWEGLQQEAPEWVRAGDKKPVLVAEYWFKEIELETICLLDDGSVVVKSDDYELPRGRKVKQERKREKVTVYLATITGNEVLEMQEWEGKYIPLIPVIGEELQPIKGERIWQGMIRPSRDGQMLYNYAASTLVERMALEPKTPFIMAEGQQEGHETEWQLANVRNLPYILYKPTTIGDKPAAPPQRAQIDSSGMSLAMMALQEGKGFVQATTAVFGPSLGEMPQRRDAQSGRAILALQQQSDAGTSHYIQNFVNISIPYEARVVLDLMPYKYDRPGRVTALVTGEDETEVVMLGQPYIQDPQTGRPVPAKPGDPGSKTYDLRKGKYGISVDVGKSFQTRMQEGGEAMTNVVQAAPEMMGIMGDLYFKFQDFPGAKEIAERLKKTISSQHPGLIEDGKNSAEAAQAENTALKQQLGQITQQLQQAADYIKTEQAKHQAQVSIAQMKAQSDLEIAKMDNAAKVLVARINSENDVANQQAEIQEELLATGIKVQAEAEKTASEHQHEREMQHEKLAHEVAMGAAGGRTVTMSRSRGQDGEREDSREMSDGASQERSEEEQPPQPEAEA